MFVLPVIMISLSFISKPDRIPNQVSPGRRQRTYQNRIITALFDQVNFNASGRATIFLAIVFCRRKGQIQRTGAGGYQPHASFILTILVGDKPSEAR
jgi:hypothetical protein